MNYNWNWGIFFQTSPDGVHTYLADAAARHRLDAGDRARRLVPGARARDRSSASFAPRPIPWLVARWAAPMSSCSATSRCWCRSSSASSCCRGPADRMGAGSSASCPTPGSPRRSSRSASTPPPRRRAGARRHPSHRPRPARPRSRAASRPQAYGRALPIASASSCRR